MKSLLRLALLGIVSCVSAVALAAGSGTSSTSGVSGTWTGPHIGVLLGGNSASTNQTSTELAFTASFLAGYDFQLSRHFVLGVGGFYEWNNEKNHNYNSCSSACSVDYGSKIYGLDGRVGFPLGDYNQYMPYIKVGYGWGNLSGDLSGSDSSPRYGIGFEWMSATGTASLLIQFMHQQVDGDHGVSLTNNNFTIGANFFF